MMRPKRFRNLKLVTLLLLGFWIPPLACGDVTDDTGTQNHTDSVVDPTTTDSINSTDTVPDGVNTVPDTTVTDVSVPDDASVNDMDSADGPDGVITVDVDKDNSSPNVDMTAPDDVIDLGDLFDTESVDLSVTEDVIMTPDSNDPTDGTAFDSGPSGPHAAGCVTEITAGHQKFWCQDRLFDIQVPQSCLESPCGLILDVHGLTMSAAMQEKNTQLRALGEQHGYIVIQPNAMPDPPLASWIPAEDDVRIETFLNDTIVAYAADKTRIHMTGFSQGGFMTWRFLCKHSTLFASVAPAAACSGGGAPACGFSGAEVPEARPPILFMHGTDDALVPFDCGKKQRDAIIDSWKLDQSTIITQDAEHLRTRYTNTAGDVFEFLQHDYTNDSPVLKSHCFPGSKDSSPTEPGQLLSYGCNPPNAFQWGQEVIQFFMAHPKQ